MTAETVMDDPLNGDKSRSIMIDLQQLDRYYRLRKNPIIYLVFMEEKKNMYAFIVSSYKS